jgi:Ribbon-helix-helix protein
LAAEERTARLTILVDPRKKAMFEQLCAEEDSTPSQVLRRLMRRYIEERTGQSWSPSPPADHPSQNAIKKPRRVTAEKMEK